MDVAGRRTTSRRIQHGTRDRDRVSGAWPVFCFVVNVTVQYFDSSAQIHQPHTVTLLLPQHELGPSFC
jgi:hypothetical protein